jgi:protein phosphatase
MTHVSAPAVRFQAFGLSHPGRVRESNEDHFIIAKVSKTVAAQHSNIPPAELQQRVGSSAAYLLAVADGVGGRPGGDVASKKTLSTILEYLGQATHCFQAMDINREHELLDALEASIHKAHDRLVQDAGGPSDYVPASTLTMVLIAWPRAYVIHVGDSRAYARRAGRLQRLTRDQTFGEHMVSVGAWTEEIAARSKVAGTLASAIGGPDLTPSIGIVDLELGDSILLCTDGLTRHVSDERLAEALAEPNDAVSTVQGLVNEALEGGGSDNVTVVLLTAAAA